MRRLVADLLLLARADAARQAPHVPTDVGEVLVEAAAELGAVAGEHDLAIDTQRAVVDGARDELHRLALNLMENAIRHTPQGTNVRAAVERVDGEVRLIVEDDGPGIPAELRERVFERFVRGEGDRGGSFGLGLSIVRAVAESHGGRVGAGHAHDQRRRAAGRDSRHALRGDAAGGQHVTAGVASSPTGATPPSPGPACPR